MKLFSKILFWLITILITINIIIYITDTTYIYTTFRYLTAGIDDHYIFEQRIIKNDKPSDWKTGTNYNQIKLPGFLINELEDLNTVAFLIIKDDSIRYEKYWDNYSRDSKTNSFSMAKSVVGILTGIAIKEGKIKSLEEPVCNYLPEFKEGEKEKITIKHLLTMTSGLEWWEVYWSPVSHTTESYYGTNLRKLINGLEVENEPGKVFRYKSCDTQILAFALTKATGTTLSDYASEKLWKPIQANLPAEWSIDAKGGMEKAYCCIYSNARDFARIGKLYLNQGSWNGNQIVPEEYVKNSITPIKIKDTTGECNDCYGYSWWLLDYKGKWFYSRGINGQYIMVLPEKNLIVVRLGHERRLSNFKNHPKDVYTLIDGVTEVF